MHKITDYNWNHPKYTLSYILHSLKHLLNYILGSIKLKNKYPCQICMIAIAVAIIIIIIILALIF